MIKIYHFKHSAFCYLASYSYIHKYLAKAYSLLLSPIIANSAQ